MFYLRFKFVTSRRLPGCRHRLPEIQSLFQSNSTNSNHQRHSQCSNSYRPHTRCPALQSHSRMVIRNRSTCPWVMCRDTDEYRYPRDIFNAQCLCSGCRGNSGDRSCQRVYHTIKVMRITGCDEETGLYNYEWGNYSVAVGCTCAQNRR